MADYARPRNDLEIAPRRTVFQSPLSLVLMGYHERSSQKEVLTSGYCIRVAKVWKSRDSKTRKATQIAFRFEFLLLRPANLHQCRAGDGGLKRPAHPSPFPNPTGALEARAIAVTPESGRVDARALSFVSRLG